MVENKIKNARIKLLKKSTNLQFFGICSYKFNWVAEDLPDTAEGYVAFNPETDECEAEPIIHINKNMLMKDDYDHNNLIILIMHELFHVLYKHGKRGRNHHHKVISNLAADHIVDSDIKKIIDDNADQDLKPYQNRYNIIPEVTRHFGGKTPTYEEVYDYLVNSIPQIKITPHQNGVNGTEGNTQPTPGQSFNVDINGKEYTITINQNPTASESKEIENFISEARSTQDALKQKGIGSSKLNTIIDELLKVEVPWEQILDKALKNAISIKPDDRSWKRLNKHFMPLNINLPGSATSTEPDSINKLIIALDTSASVSKTELKKFANVISESSQYFKKIVILVHDTVIHVEKHFDSDNSIEITDFITKNITGGGGTSHKPVFDRISKIHDNGHDYWDWDNEDEISMVILLTDGYSDIHYIYKKYEWTKKVPISIILSSDWSQNFDYNTFDLIHIND